MFTEHRVHYSIRNTKSEVIGFLTFRSFKYMALQLEIYLNEQYRGKKIMSIILGNLLQQTQRSDIMSMTAFVDLENQNSIRLIEKLGFKETNRNGKAIGYEYDFRQVHE